MGTRHHQDPWSRRKPISSSRSIELASTEAGKIALKGGSADHDPVGLAVGRARARAGRWPGVLSLSEHARRGDGAGAIRRSGDLADLKGKKLAVAGGPLDKSWLLLQALARRSGLDLRKQATIVYGAPPLLAEKALQGETDATLTFWNFCADLEGKGFKRAIAMDDVMKGLGAKGRSPSSGYAFDGAWAARNRIGGRVASSRSRPRPRTFSPAPRPNGSGSPRASARPMRPRSRSTASVTARASRAGRSPTKRPTPRRSTARSPRSAALTWSARRASSPPEPSIGRPGESELWAQAHLPRASDRRLVCRLADCRRAPAARIRKQWRSRSWTEASSGALAFNLGATLARVAVAFAIAMASGTVIGLVDGALAARRPAGRSLARSCCSTCRRW